MDETTDHDTGHLADSVVCTRCWAIHEAQRRAADDYEAVRGLPGYPPPEARVWHTRTVTRGEVGRA